MQISSARSYRPAFPSSSRSSRRVAAAFVLCSTSLLYRRKSTVSMAVKFEKVPNESLFVSEPPPDWFGNARNDPSPAWTNKNWLKSRFHFSFAEYRDPLRSSWGVLRVLNDDLVQPDRGFGAHPHRDMEIATYIVEGELTHKDSMGTSETLSRGGVQFMTAGRGVTHSEHNLNKEKPLRFIQMWIQPRAGGLKPSYGGFSGDAEGRRDKWQHLVGDAQSGGSGAAVKIEQDANIHVTEISPGRSVEFPLASGRQAYLLCLEGAAEVGAAGGALGSLVAHDAAKVGGGATLSVAAGAAAPAHVLLIEMKAT